MKLEILYDSVLQTKDGKVVLQNAIPDWQMIYFQEIVKRVNLYEELKEAAENFMDSQGNGLDEEMKAYDKLEAVLEKSKQKYRAK